MPPSLRLDRYELLEPLASGGMATVYLGRVLGAGGFQRLVAIKMMHPHLAQDPDFVAMFLDEARLAANIRHPNVVPTFDVQQDTAGVLIVLEYIEGASLYGIERMLRKQRETLPIGITLRIMFDTLAGLHAAHDLVNLDGRPLGLVHRDVSPQNILVGNDGIARITDFGIARAESRVTTTRGGQLKGRLAYMSPEVIRSERATRQSDVYAAGVVLWEMLTGRSLFVADNDAALMAQVLGGPGRTPREINPDVPWQIDEACMRALEEPSDRYRSAAGFAEGLERAAERAGIAVAMPRMVASYARRAHAERPRPTVPPLPPTVRSEPSRAGRTLVLPHEPPPRTEAMPARPVMTQPAMTQPVLPAPWPAQPAVAYAEIPPPAFGPSFPPGTPVGTPISSVNLSNAAIMLPTAPPPKPARSGVRFGAAVVVASLLTGTAVWFVARGTAPEASTPVPAVSPVAAAPVAPQAVVADPALPSASASVDAAPVAPPPAETAPPAPARAKAVEPVEPPAPKPKTATTAAADPAPRPPPTPAAPKPAAEAEPVPAAAKPFRPDDL